MNRILQEVDVQLTPGNWKPLFIGALCIAQKFGTDSPLINQDFCIFYPALQPWALAKLEHTLLALLRWRLQIPYRTFCQYYFELHSLHTSQEFAAPEAKRISNHSIAADVNTYEQYKHIFRGRKQPMTREDVRVPEPKVTQVVLS